MDELIIIGAGIGGLTLALSLARVGIPSRIFEASRELRPVGVGINLLPYATRELANLGLEEKLAKYAITTRQRAFFNRFGQLVYEEPLGRAAGFEHPQFSIHRADLQRVLLDAVIARLGTGCVITGQACTHVETDHEGVTVHLAATATGETSAARARVAVGADGIHSSVRRQLYPDEGPPRYSGVNMWRGVTRWPPILGGAAMILTGCLAIGQTVIYPIRDNIDASGRQLVNWVFEMETPSYRTQDWSRPGHLRDFLPLVAGWQFEWLDLPAFLRAADMVLEFPMVDRDPLPRWSHGYVTLLGDAAHPMVPRGSNGAGQAILDATTLAECLATGAASDAKTALMEYDYRQRKRTARIVLMNRTRPPDAILNEVHRRTGDKPFTCIENVISHAELRVLLDAYKQVTDVQRDATEEVCCGV